MGTLKVIMGNLKEIIWLVPDMKGLGGSEYLTCNFCRLLAESGIQVHLITGAINTAWKNVLQTEKTEPTIHLINLQSYKYSDFKEAVNALKKRSISLMQIMPIEGVGLELLETENYDFPVCGLEPTDLSAKCWWLPENLKNIFKKLDGLIVLNPSAKTVATEKYSFDGPVNLVHHTLMEDIYKPEKRIYEKATFGCISRLSAEKGLEYLLAAMHLLNREFPAITMSIWGGGEDEQRLKNLAKMLGISSQVFFHGEFHPIEDSIAVTQGAKVFVQPSLFEGSPTSLLELASRKVPVISSDTNGGKWVLGEDFYGLTAIGDTNALANAMHKTISDSNFSELLVNQAFQRSQTVFTRSRTKEQLIAFYSEVCSKLKTTK